MKVAQLPVDTMDKVMNLLAEFPYKAVAPVLMMVQSQVKLVDVDPPVNQAEAGGLPAV